MTDLFSLEDLNTEINHEPRVLDITLGQRLGMARPREIRRVIENNRDELEAFGSLAVCNRKSRGQVFTEFYLNEPQALLICMFSRTEKAAAVRKALVDVFMLFRRQEQSATSEHIARMVEDFERAKTALEGMDVAFEVIRSGMTELRSALHYNPAIMDENTKAVVDLRLAARRMGRP